MALRFMKWMTGLVALCSASFASAASVEPVSWADQVREKRDSSSLMQVATGASLFMSRSSLLSGWFDFSERDSWINTVKLSDSPGDGAALNLSADHMASVAVIASSTVLYNSWVSFSQGSIASIQLLSISISEIRLATTPTVVSLGPSAAVPLPAAGWLFLSALGPFLMGVKRRRRN
jgi:hypothetical protein